MFEAFFGLTGHPFDKSIAPVNMFHSQSFKELDKRFDYMLDYRGIMVLTGESGTGKTCALRHLTHRLSQHFKSVYLPLSTLKPSDFYRYLNNSLQGERAFFKSDVFKSIQTKILDFALNQKTIPVIIFDEAHLLREENLLELQLISNIQGDSYDPAIYILCGQKELLGKLAKPSLSSFAQRINLRHHLEALSREETEAYILHQLKTCNSAENIFKAGAFDNIYKLSKGTIRLIASISTKALVLAFLEKRKTIEAEDIVKLSQEI